MSEAVVFAGVVCDLSFIVTGVGKEKKYKNKRLQIRSWTK